MFAGRGRHPEGFAKRHACREDLRLQTCISQGTGTACQGHDPHGTCGPLRVSAAMDHGNRVVNQSRDHGALRLPRTIKLAQTVLARPDRMSWSIPRHGAGLASTQGGWPDIIHPDRPRRGRAHRPTTTV